jgi:mono/diheme cytochrome c family protein
MKRQFIIWSCTAIVACALLVGALIWGHNRHATAAVFPSGDPHRGARLFEEKGCVHCHRVRGHGGKTAPDLAFNAREQPSVDHVVAAMWSHAPEMLRRMRAEGMEYPTLNQHEIVDLVTFLYAAHAVDDCGGTPAERHALAAKGCLRCHNCVPVTFR